jgi:hypothetical protein
MQRVLQAITVRTLKGAPVELQATCYGPWCVHQTLDTDKHEYTITYEPLGLAASSGLEREEALRKAEELYRRVPEYSSEHLSMVKHILAMPLETQRAR